MPWIRTLFLHKREYEPRLIKSGKADEALREWARVIERTPNSHDYSYGYAEFCLYLGHEAEYHRACQALLNKFSETKDPQIADRTARACMLMPFSGEALRQCISLIERAVPLDRLKNNANYPYFVFLHGLGAYRQGNYETAISRMKGDASRVLGPAPRLVLAMSQYKTGLVTESRKTLAAAVLAHDWTATKAVEQEGWIYHVLRREAENMILPNLPAFLAGKYQPQDNDERMATCRRLSIYQSSCSLGSPLP
ncbi:MAG: hypothetical protein QM703_22485 [Gemmatales bacterium]